MAIWTNARERRLVERADRMALEQNITRLSALRLMIGQNLKQIEKLEQDNTIIAVLDNREVEA